MATNNLIESVKDGIVGTIKGTGEIINAVTDCTATDFLDSRVSVFTRPV